MVIFLKASRARFELSPKEYRALQRRKETEEKRLLRTAKRRLPKLKVLLAKVSSPKVCEDGIYRFYQQSGKLQSRLAPRTLEVVAALQSLAPHLKLNADFQLIVAEGTGKRADERRVVEAFFHARHMLAMAVKYAEELPKPPRVLPSGYATFLSLYNLRGR